MALIDTAERVAECPHCGEEQTVRFNVPVGTTKTARFECVDCEGEFEVTVGITYTLDVEAV